MLALLSSDYACPNIKEPRFDPDNAGWNAWDGHKNGSYSMCDGSFQHWQMDGLNGKKDWPGAAVNFTTFTGCTTCVLNETQINKENADGYGKWMERGNQFYGMPTYPAHTRKDEPTFIDAENTEKLRMLVDDNFLPYSSVDIANIPVICKPQSGDVQVTPIYNISLYASGKQGVQAVGKNRYLDKHHVGEYGEAHAPFTTTVTNGHARLATTDIKITESTNPNFFKNDGTWTSYEVKEDKTKNDAETDTNKQHWIITIMPEPFTIGSTTVRLEVGDADVRFTVSNIQFMHCPYTVSFFGMNLLPVCKFFFETAPPTR